MRRRRYLAALPSTALLVAPSGCLSGPVAPGAGGARRVRVSSVETFPLALRLNDAGPPSATAPTLADLDERERRVVEAALDGEYTTDSVPTWLAEFADGTPYVRHDGTFYALDADLPVHVVTGERVDRSAVEGTIATPEEYREAVTLEHGVFTGFVRVAADDGYRVHDILPQLRAFVEEYAATEYHGDVVRLDYTVEDPGSPYTVTADPTTAEAVYGGSVLFADETDPAVAELLRAAGPTEGLHRVADPPDGLADLVREHEYVHADGRFYYAYVETAPDVPVAFDAAPVERGSDGDPRVRFSVRNDGERPVEVFSGAPPPFGVLRARSPDHETRGTLWTEAYEESRHVHVRNGQVNSVNSVGITTSVPAGDSAERTFRLRRRDLPPGEWVVEGNVGIEVRDDREAGGTLPYRVRFRVQK